MRRVSPIWLGLAAALGAAACTPVNRGCGPTTCSGCCDPTGTCQYGNTALACGEKGLSCTQCQLGEVCKGALCLLSGSGPDAGRACDDRTCNGCCRNGTCLRGVEPAACGISGGDCESCAGNQQCTSVGRCQNAACSGCIDSAGLCQTGQDSAACGAHGYSCVACTQGASCNSSGFCVGGTCDGCRDSQGVCRAGTTHSACGRAGAVCRACQANEECSATTGACVVVVAPDAGTGTCNGANCPDGCCSGSACITRTSSAKCGAAGAACSACTATQTCQAGACVACAGCIDPVTGVCNSGTGATSCGRAGSFCQACDTAHGQTCTNGTCQGGDCNASNCPVGCCSGGTCVLPDFYTDQRCGSGTKGAACVACSGACDRASGRCSSAPSDAGSPGDGGLPTCDPKAPSCGAGECCGSLLGIYLCMTNGSSFSGLGAYCGSSGVCEFCSLLSGAPTCNTSTGHCQ